MSDDVMFNQVILDQLSQVDLFLKDELKKESTAASSAYMSYVMETKGKLIRPSLLLLSAQAIGGKKSNSKELIKASAGLELIHIASLIHDDIIDEADFRRDKPTVVKEFGIQPALILGIQFYAISLKWLSSLEIWEVMQTVSKAVQSMCEGEFIQFQNRYRFVLSQDVYFDILKHKTADLFSASCLVGGYLAKATASECEDLKQFGYHLGMLFQLTDDYLDMIDPDHELKKETHQDFKTGQFTLPMVLLLNTQPLKDRESFFKQMSLLSLPELHTLMVKHQVDEKLYEKVLYYKKKSIEILSKFQENEFSKSLFFLLEFIALRIKK